MPNKKKIKASKCGTAPKLTRHYTQRTLKILFALSGNQCAEPNCRNPIIKSATAASPQLVLAEICHILALSEDGPRGRANLTEAELNQPSNLMLFCPTHHTIVDGQHKTYPAELLQKWKAAHELKYGESISHAVSDIGYAEIEVVARALVSGASTRASQVLHAIPPKEKIAKNSLGSSSEMLLMIGSAKSQEVAELLVKASQLDEGLPERLRTGFVTRYESARTQGISGDTLFAELYEWAAGDDGDRAREAAGLCILSHLFIICDVFEK